MIKAFSAGKQIMPTNHPDKYMEQKTKAASETISGDLSKIHGEDCPAEYVFGKAFFPKWKLDECPFQMRRWHEWYMRASALGVEYITARISSEVFADGGSNLVIDFKDMHAMFRREKLDINLIAVWCM